MAIYRLLQNSPFGPAELERMTAAYEQALTVLGLPSGTGPANQEIAKRIVEIAQTGILDPAKICALAVESYDQG